MGVQGLTIYHVKSHLQKYRLAKFIPDPSRDGIDKERMQHTDILANDGTATGLHITESLRMQMEVQKRLHEQLEVQRQLQLRIEAQGKYLQKILEEQQRLTETLQLPMNVFKESEVPQVVEPLAVETPGSSHSCPQNMPHDDLAYNKTGAETGLPIVLANYANQPANDFTSQQEREVAKEPKVAQEKSESSCEQPSKRSRLNEKVKEEKDTKS
ncbi:hypothetical protein KP509_02G038900 [Ceratopteris richardii]|nr:hypothetical protein KP509_02G038900 [Ceratopteris richardii]